MVQTRRSLIEVVRFKFATPSTNKSGLNLIVLRSLLFRSHVLNCIYTIMYKIYLHKRIFCLLSKYYLYNVV